MPRPVLPALILGLMLATPASAQHHGHSTPSPYATFADRHIKALSTQETADLAAGRGMGLALSAELNGYPGPLHVLELADRLELDPAQRERTASLLEAMKMETIPIGRQIIAQEEELDRLFAARQANTGVVAATTARIGSAHGQLRAAHLRYHLAMVEILRPEQIARYGMLRGYGQDYSR